MKAGAKDRLRASAPVDTVRPRPRDPQVPPPVLTDKKLRQDGRGVAQFRPFYMKTGVVSQASGSAYLEIEKTKVIVAVYGPRQTQKMEYSEKGRIDCEFKYAPFACPLRRKHQQDHEELEYSSFMNRALEVSVRMDKYPKSSVDVYALVLQDDGGALSAAITCASMALADAGIEMFDLVAACHAAHIQGSLLLDPTLSEEMRRPVGLVVVAFMPSLNEISQLVLSGEMDVSVTKKAIELCTDGCSQLYSVMRVNLIESAGKAHPD